MKAEPGPLPPEKSDRVKNPISNPLFWVLLFLLGICIGIFFNPPFPLVAALEMCLVVAMGTIIGFWLREHKRLAKVAAERAQAISALTVIQDQLRDQIRSALRRERELTALSRLSSSLSEYLEMEPLLRSAMSMVVEVMGVEAVLIFTLEADTGQISLKAHQGVQDEYARAIDRIKVGEGFNGHVAETGEPLLIEDTAKVTRLDLEAVRQEDLKTVLVVPMKSKGKVMGTLAVGVHQRRVFGTEDIDLLTAIASQIGVGIENARLAEQQLKTTAQLSRSEKHYRELFERANDAIWVHDMEGRILRANQASAVLSGYSVEELLKMRVREFFSPEALGVARELRARLLKGENIRQPYEQRLFRRDGSEAILMLTTSLIGVGDETPVFQNIARDITEDRAMQDSLRTYVQQITNAQEEERLRIARELHDSTAQNLIVLLHRLESFLHDRPDLPMEKVREMWSFHEQTKDILQEIRIMSRHLRPSVLDDAGLLPAIHLIVREMKTDYGIDAGMEVHGPERRFAPEVELVLFRVVQEALRNAGRHSHATHAEVLITFEEKRVILTIRDNGSGFQLPGQIRDLSRDGKLGMVGMLERVELIGATLDVKSAPSRGTWVTITAPL